MKKYTAAFALLIALAFYPACQSSKSQLERGNYEESVGMAVQKLRGNPSNKKALNALSQAYPLALDVNLNEISQLMGSTDMLKWERIAKYYDRLNNMHDAIKRCPGCLKVVPDPKSFLQEYTQAKERGAEELYNAGIRSLATKDRRSARDAHDYFRRADQMLSNYKDSRAKMEEAKFYATLKVVVEHMPVGAARYSLSQEFFQNQIFEYLFRKQIDEYIRFYSPQEAQNQNIKYPDHVVKLRFDDFMVGQSHLQEKTETFSKDSVVVGKANVAGKEIDVYGTVKATLTTYHKTVLSNGLLDMTIIEGQSGRLLRQDKLSGEFRWENRWANYNGDERALTPAQLALCRDKERMPPQAQDLFVEFCRPIASQVETGLKRFYTDFNLLLKRQCIRFWIHCRSLFTAGFAYF